MWDWHSWRCTLPTTLQKPPNQSSLLTPQHQNDAVCHRNCISFAAVARMLTSWLNRRRCRYLLLILCFPFLLPLFCAMCPLICVMEIWFFVCRRRREAAQDGGEAAECGEEGGLLQRYLEDQLMLVIGDCGEEDGVDVQYFDSLRPLLQ